MVKRQEAVSKPHLVSDGCVALRFEMLTYSVYAPLSNRIVALPSNTTWAFETTSIKNA
jgi:hypothetical protein